VAVTLTMDNLLGNTTCTSPLRIFSNDQAGGDEEEMHNTFRGLTTNAVSLYSPPGCVKNLPSSARFYHGVLRTTRQCAARVC
jgi:hypothetical protein